VYRVILDNPYRMDIDDILASVTRDHHTALGTVDKDAEASQAQLDLQLLTRAWVSERVTPELLPYPTALMERVMQRIRDQVCSSCSLENVAAQIFSKT
jgi:GINS complex subunit 4